MDITILIILGIIGFFLVIWILWRLSSHRYSLPCPTWLGWLVELDNPFAKVNQAATIIENLDLQEGMTVVDIGCGPGRVTIPAARRVGKEGKVIAMDMQIGMLQRTQEKAKDANLTNIKFLHAAVGKHKLERDKFDRVLLVTVLGEIPDQDTALKEIFASLKPGGVLSVTEIIFDPHFQRLNTALRRASAIGFKEKNRFGNCVAYTLNLEKPVLIVRNQG